MRARSRLPGRADGARAVPRAAGARHGAADDRPVPPDAEVAPRTPGGARRPRACGRPPRAARRRPRAARARRRRPPPRRRRGPSTSRRARPASPPGRPCRHLPSCGPACRYRTARGTRPNRARGVLATISVEEPLFSASPISRDWSVFGQVDFCQLRLCQRVCPILLHSRFGISRLEQFQTCGLLPTGVLSGRLSETATLAD